jgi:hypothetical protein
MNAIDGLKTEFNNLGLIVDSPILDGTFKKCATTTHPTKKKGWYIGWSKFVGGKDIICCSIGDYTTGGLDVLCSYQSWQDDHQFSKIDRDAIEKYQAELQRKIAADKAKKQKEAAKAAQQQWLLLSDTGNSQYLKDKDVKAHGIRYGYDEKEGDFIAVPIRDYGGDIIRLAAHL